MFLSNRSPIVIVFLVLAWLPACSWFGSGDTPQPLVSVPTPQTDTPFAVREPEEFSADFVTIAGGTETRRGYARKGSSWKFVIYDADDPISETIQNGKLILIDHKRRVFAEAVEQIGFDPDFIQEMTVRILREREYTSFEDLGSEGSIRRYRAAIRGQETSPSIIHYDESLKMITKQEFFQNSGETPVFVYEMRNVELEVPEAVFIPPANYRKITADAYYSGQNKEK